MPIYEVHYDRTFDVCCDVQCDSVTEAAADYMEKWIVNEDPDQFNEAAMGNCTVFVREADGTVHEIRIGTPILAGKAGCVSSSGVYVCLTRQGKVVGLSTDGDPVHTALTVADWIADGCVVKYFADLKSGEGARYHKAFMTDECMPL
jgi:hypothetical protein